MINQYFTDLSSSQDNYEEIISLCKHLINPTAAPTVTRLVGGGNNGKSTLMNVIRQLTNANHFTFPEDNFNKEYIDTMDLSKPTILYIEESKYGFFEHNIDLFKTLPKNLHVVYVANTLEPLLATLNTLVKTIYMVQHVNNPNMLYNLNMQDMLQFINNA